MSYKKFLSLISMVTITAALTLSGCSLPSVTTGSAGSTQTASGSTAAAVVSSGSISQIDTSEMFTDRDLSGEYDESSSYTITLSDNTSSTTSDSVKIDGSTITITEEGTYVITGSLSDGQIVVDAPDDAKVQLVLKDASLSNGSSACIYSKNADKVFVTSAKGSTNSLSVTGDYVAIDDSNIDAAIYSKTDIVLNGSGTLNISASYGHGVVSKDDLKVCGGTYNITSAQHGLSGKDSVRIADGTINITCKSDGIHSSNDDDASLGYTYIKDGTININAEDEGIHADTLLQIDGGKIDVSKSNEGIEAQTIVVNDGDINVVSDDDGFNASSGSSTDSASTDSDKSGRTAMAGTDSDKKMQRPDSSDVSSDSAISGNSGRGHMGRGGFGRGRMGENGQMPERPDDSTDGSRPERPDGSTSGSRPQRPDGENNGNFDGGHMGGHGGMGGGMMDVDESCSLTINGGTINVDAGGDGLDSNGSLTVNGGSVYVSGPTNDGNGALDSGTEAVINGGVVIAAGSSGMAESFSSSSKQASMLLTASGSQTGEIKITDSNGKTVASYTPSKSYSSVVISAPEITTDGTYSVTLGSETQSITMNGTVYGESRGMGQKGKQM